jgi:ketopantoate reductase
VSVQHYRFAEMADFLAGRVSKASILVFNNFWVDPQAATVQLPADRLVWGFPVAGGGFNEAGQLRGSLLKNVHFGTFSADPTERELSVRSTFQDAGFKIVEHRDFRGWLWTHFAINAGLHSQTLKAGSILRVFQVISEGRNAVLNIRELIPILQARGVDLKAHRSEIHAVSASSFARCADPRTGRVQQARKSNPRQPCESRRIAELLPGCSRGCAAPGRSNTKAGSSEKIFCVIHSGRE